MIQIIFILLIWSIIIGGTKFINYSSKFFFLQKNLSFYDKINYFNINFVTNFILKVDVKIQKFVIYYLLLPILKINYIFLSVITSILFKFNQKYFDKLDIIKKQEILYNNDNDINNYNNNENNSENNSDNNDDNNYENNDDNNYENNDDNYKNNDANNNIFDSIRMIKSGSSSSNDNEIPDNYDKNIIDQYQALDDNKTVGLLLNNELNLLEKNKNILNKNKEILKVNEINEGDELDENNINNYLINNNIKNNSLKEYVNIINSSNGMPMVELPNEIINDEIVETIRIDEIDFGNIVNNIIINEKKEEKINSIVSDKKVNSTIRIGKKKI